MNATERAAELGREHGERDAKAWTAEYAGLLEVLSPERINDHYEDMPEPDLSGGYTSEHLWKDCGAFAPASGDPADFEPFLFTIDRMWKAYVAAYREARDRVIREAVQ